MATLSASADIARIPPESSRERARPSGQDNALIPRDSSLLKDVEVVLQARLGEVVMPIAELLELRSGSILSLAKNLGEPIELYLNNLLVARGEIVAVDDMFGVRISEVAET